MRVVDLLRFIQLSTSQVAGRMMVTDQAMVLLDLTGDCRKEIGKNGAIETVRRLKRTFLRWFFHESIVSNQSEGLWQALGLSYDS